MGLITLLFILAPVAIASCLILLIPLGKTVDGSYESGRIINFMITIFVAGLCSFAAAVVMVFCLPNAQQTIEVTTYQIVDREVDPYDSEKVVLILENDGVKTARAVEQSDIRNKEYVSITDEKYSLLTEEHFPYAPATFLEKEAPEKVIYYLS